MEVLEQEDSSASDDSAVVISEDCDFEDAESDGDVNYDNEIMLLSNTPAATSLSPHALSGEMLYFCRYESGQNYNAGLSYGDDYHALGYFQFDNRYGLANFLYSVYCYNSTKYSCIKTLGDKYG